MPKKKNQAAPSRRISFPVVGIGASAGGIEAIGQLLSALPPDTGLAFVVVQHLDPTHESLSVDILSRTTKMPTVQIRDDMRVEPNHVYVIPPNKNLAIFHGALKLLARSETAAPHLAVDFFFQSLAEELKTQAIGVVLSGTASDGTRGLEAIKSEGGWAFAQEPSSAKYDGMPRSAISSGVVDFVLSPQDIAAELVRIGRHPLVRPPGEQELPAETFKPSGPEHDALARLFILLRNQCHVDFSRYKLSTLRRRIQRRMLVQKKETLEDYVNLLKKSPDEATALFSDILINVTEFFRDPDAFAELQKRAFPEIVRNRPQGMPIRIWTVGCASGEEAYSVAISLLEFLGEKASDTPIQIFATDISEAALRKARAGFFPESITRNVSRARLQRHFTKVEGGYQISKEIREKCLFSRHDVTNDPPFAKLDLVCCRNLLIYFEAALQQQVLQVLHYALNPGGFLWLGRSETIGALTPLFSAVERTSKLYAKKPARTSPRFQIPTKAFASEPLERRQAPAEKIAGTSDVQKEADRIALAEYAPPGVVVDQDMDIVLVRGDTTPYLTLPAGQVSLNLFKMARPALLSDLRMAVLAAKKQNAPAKRAELSIREDDQRWTLSINVFPLKSPGRKEPYFLILFERLRPSTSPAEPGTPGSDRLIQELEKRLSETQAYQRTLNEDADATREALTAANEELQSTNEELQSTNEELETAKEELQSANEELTTVNDELQSRNSDLNLVNNDLINLLSAVDVPIAMVGPGGLIRRFTASAGKALNIRAGDIGRPIGDLKTRLDVSDLETLVFGVIETVLPIEREVRDQDGHWFRLQIHPYKTADNRIDGAVVALLDIDVLKQRLTENKVALEYLVSVADTVTQPLVVLDSGLKLMSANRAFRAKFGSVKDGTDVLSSLTLDENIERNLRELLKRTTSSTVELTGYEITNVASREGPRSVVVSARQISWIGQEPLAILVAFDDISDRRRLESERTELLNRVNKARDEAEYANRAKDLFLSTLSHELRTPLTAIMSWAQLLDRVKTDPAKLALGIKTIDESARAQAQLIDDLLDVSRMQSGKLSLDFEMLDPVTVVQATVESLRAVSESKPVRIETRINGNVGLISADRHRLRQIVSNLLTNAIKFSSANGVIEVSISRRDDQEKPSLCIMVKDHGKGIKPAFLPHLFERFSQADSSSTRVHAGLGLGLAIVRDLVTLHGGNVTAASAGENKGATFTVQLPLPSTPGKQPEKPTAPDENLSMSSLCGARLLLVDDEPISLSALKEMLIFAGAQVLVASSAAEALAAFVQFPPDLLVSDIAMPIEDGYSLIRKIRDHERQHGGHLQALALTAFAGSENVDRALSVGFDAHASKPFDIHELTRILIRLLNRRVGA